MRERLGAARYDGGHFPLAARLFEGEDLYECIEELARKEGVKSAAVLITGGFRKASVVVGPKQVPINAAVSKVTKIGGQLMSVGGGVRYWADSPASGPEGFGFRLVVTLLFPK